MKERPIIMQAESVRAILDGRKTQMRRVVKSQPPDIANNGEWYADLYNHGPQWCWWGKAGTSVHNKCLHHIGQVCPHGQPGDRLWVKEAWAMNTPPSGAIYKADGDVYDQKWKSPLFLPRWASRITLELVNVRVERVRDISEADAEAEGVPEWDDRPFRKMWCHQCHGQGLRGSVGPNLGFTEVDCADCDTKVKLYRNLWNSIHGKNPARCWEANPWTWALEFKRVKP